MAADSPQPVRVCFIDLDGLLGRMIEALREFSEPLDIERVESVPAAIDTMEDDSFDCYVVRGAMDIDGAEPADGVETVREVRAQLPAVPPAIYSDNLSHERLRRAFEADISIISDAPESPELVYRQIRYAAGMERHFQSAGDLLESLFSHYPHHLFLKDEVGRFEALSDATAREYDLDPEVIIGLTDFDLLEYETAIEAYREEQSLMETGERIVERIDHWVDEDGNDRWMSMTKAPRYDDDGNPVGIVGSTREVTKEKRKEQMVRELHTVSRELVRAESKAEIGRAVMAMASDIPVFSHIQVVFTESDGSVHPLEGRSGQSLFDRYGERFRTVIDDGTPQYVTADGQSTDEPTEAEDLAAAVLPLGGHGALGLAADAGSFTDFGIDLANILASNLEAALDRTERERDLERQNEHLEEFASIVSHDLRNPLNVASSATELLAEDVDSPQIDRIESALTRMEELIEALLTLARKGQVVGEAEFVTVETAARTAWEVIDAPEATLTVVSSGVLPADENRLVELFENLFRNAVEHGSTSPPSQAQEDAVEHGREDVSITVGVREELDGFYVADDGQGIDPAVRDELFEMGVSGADGTGYGLYIVSTIAEAHDWEVSAGESDSGGARFDITGMPIEKAEFEPLT